MSDKITDWNWLCLGAPVWVWFADHWQLRVMSSAFGFEQGGVMYWFTDHTHYRLDATDVRCIEPAHGSNKKPSEKPAHLQ